MDRKTFELVFSVAAMFAAAVIVSSCAEKEEFYYYLIVSNRTQGDLEECRVEMGETVSRLGVIVAGKEKGVTPMYSPVLDTIRVSWGAANERVSEVIGVPSEVVGKTSGSLNVVVTPDHVEVEWFDMPRPTY